MQISLSSNFFLGIIFALFKKPCACIKRGCHQDRETRKMVITLWDSMWMNFCWHVWVFSQFKLYFPKENAIGSECIFKHLGKMGGGKCCAYKKYKCCSFLFYFSSLYQIISKSLLQYSVFSDFLWTWSRKRVKTCKKKMCLWKLELWQGGMEKGVLSIFSYFSKGHHNIWEHLHKTEYKEG